MNQRKSLWKFLNGLKDDIKLGSIDSNKDKFTNYFKSHLLLQRKGDKISIMKPIKEWIVV